MVSIKDVAAACNVSIATVSRALNNGREVSEKTKEYILRVSKEMGYTPNATARNLIMNRTNMIGLILPDIGNQYYAKVSKGVSAYLDGQGYGLILCNSDRSIEKETGYLRFLMQKRVDGIILIPQVSSAAEYEVEFGTVPVVLADNMLQALSASFVGNDNYSGARGLFTHMLRQGYRRIGAILGGEASSASLQRLSAYRDVMKEQGISVDEDILINSKATFEDGYRLAKELVEKQVDAIFGINDTVAIGVMKYCYQAGIRIPEDLGLAGYDDIEQAAMLHVPLTTVHQKKFELGEMAARLLIQKIDDNQAPAQKVILQPELMIRKSCKE